MPVPIYPRRISALLAALIIGAFPFSEVWASDPLGLYLHGGIGQSEMGADVSGFTGGEFRQKHSAFQGGFGIRPISLLGAEVAYIDLGHPRGSIDSFPADMTTRGAAAFGILHLPLPLPAFDFYAKAGAARLQSKLNSTNSRGALPLICTVEFGCAYEPGPFPISRTATSFAAGAGAEYRLGSWSLRAEYQRFNVSSGNPHRLSAGNSLQLENPSFLSVGVTWKLL
jgi:opacity protein-like surface antigen